MSKIKSIQGKEFNYSDILCYQKVGNQIVVILNDKEQMRKYAVSREKEDFPNAILLYSDELFQKIVLQMKQIKDCPLDIDGTIKVEYEDGTNMNFDNKNKSIIDAIVVEQRIAKERKKAISFDLSSISKTNSNTLENDEVIEEKRFKVKKVENSKLKGVKTNMILNAISFACWSLSTLLSIVNPETYSSFTHLYVLFSISSCFNMIDSIAKKTSLEKQIKEQEIEERLNEMKNIAEKGKSKWVIEM